MDYLAHSCFLLEHKGFRLLFDPYDPSIGYPPPKVYSVDLVVVSHEHSDHNAVNQVSGATQVARGVARRQFGPVTLDGEIGWHGEGTEADPVSLTLLEWADYRIAHFGDLGCALESDQAERFKDLDLLLIPCGGGYTIDGAMAAKIVQQLKPRFAVPMHYQTPFLDRQRFPGFQTAEPFLNDCQKFSTVEHIRQGYFELPERSQQKSDAESTVTVLNIQHQMA